MFWIPALIFVAIVIAVCGGFFLLGSADSERAEIKKRLSLLELRTLSEEEIPEVLKSELLSDVPLLNKILARLGAAVRIDMRLKQADLKIRVGAFLLLSLTLFALGIAAGLLLHWPAVFSVAVGGLLFFVPNTVVNIKKRLRVKKFLSHFPDALEMFARSLRAGHSFTGAIQLVAQEMPDPIAPEFQKVFDEQNLGIPLRHALVGMTERIDSLDLKFFVTAILIQRETGGNLAEIIDKIAYVIRERFRVQGQLKIFTAQARMTGIVLALLPLGAAFLVSILNPDYLKPLWFDRIGKIMIALAVFLQIMGALAIRKIMRIKI